MPTAQPLEKSMKSRSKSDSASLMTCQVAPPSCVAMMRPAMSAATALFAVIASTDRKVALTPLD